MPDLTKNKSRIFFLNKSCWNVCPSIYHWSQTVTYRNHPVTMAATNLNTLRLARGLLYSIFCQDTYSLPVHIPKMHVYVAGWDVFLADRALCPLSSCPWSEEDRDPVKVWDPWFILKYEDGWSNPLNFCLKYLQFNINAKKSLMYIIGRKSLLLSYSTLKKSLSLHFCQSGW